MVEKLKKYAPAFFAGMAFYIYCQHYNKRLSVTCNSKFYMFC